MAGQVPEWIKLLPFGLVKSVKGDFNVDEESLTEIIGYFEARGNDVVIDYEHQTLDGGQAPAAGWVKELQDRGPDGLWARVDWTERAREYLANKEYRYLSPVVLVRRADNKAVAIHSVALTNAPAMSGVRPIVNNITKELVTRALREGKIAPALKEWAEQYALKDLDGFKAFLDQAPQMVPLSPAPGRGGGKLGAGADEVQMSVNKLLGVSEEDFKKYGQEAYNHSGMILTNKAGFYGQSDDIQVKVNKLLGISEEDFKKYGQV
ncbi:MAG: hypothetical protein HPY50_00540 [Firmicutes bacterium]|nr:hypothetical protein [Bacillota bacterium]